MKIHLITATVLGLAGAGFVMSPAAFAYTNSVGSNSGMSYKNGPQRYGNTGTSGRQGYRTRDNGMYAGQNGQQAMNQRNDNGWTRNKGWIGSSGNGSSQNTGVRSHEYGQQAMNQPNNNGWTRNKDWIGSSGNGSSQNTGVRSHESSATGSMSR